MNKNLAKPNQKIINFLATVITLILMAFLEYFKNELNLAENIRLSFYYLFYIMSPLFFITALYYFYQFKKNSIITPLSKPVTFIILSIYSFFIPYLVTYF